MSDPSQDDVVTVEFRLSSFEEPIKKTMTRKDADAAAAIWASFGLAPVKRGDRPAFPPF